MPHLVLLYTPNLDAETDMGALCRTLADGMLQVRDEAGAQVFPTGGTRVLAYPAAHSAVADGKGDYAFVYMNLRMAGGRSDAVKKAAGDTVLERAKAHLAPVFAKRLIGLTVQVDESPGQVYDGKHSTLHPHFNPPVPVPAPAAHPTVIPAQAGIQAGAQAGSAGSPPPRG